MTLLVIMIALLPQYKQIGHTVSNVANQFIAGKSHVQAWMGGDLAMFYEVRSRWLGSFSYDLL